jgi:hypothetical protein
MCEFMEFRFRVILNIETKDVKKDAYIDFDLENSPIAEDQIYKAATFNEEADNATKSIFVVFLFWVYIDGLIMFCIGEPRKDKPTSF